MLLNLFTTLLERFVLQGSFTHSYIQEVVSMAECFQSNFHTPMNKLQDTEVRVQ